jgi:hypothetical protein
MSNRGTRQHRRTHRRGGSHWLSGLGKRLKTSYRILRDKIRRKPRHHPLHISAEESKKLVAEGKAVKKILDKHSKDIAVMKTLDEPQKELPGWDKSWDSKKGGFFSPRRRFKTLKKRVLDVVRDLRTGERLGTHYRRRKKSEKELPNVYKS